MQEVQSAMEVSDTEEGAAEDGAPSTSVHPSVDSPESKAAVSKKRPQVSCWRNRRRVSFSLSLPCERLLNSLLGVALLASQTKAEEPAPSSLFPEERSEHDSKKKKVSTEKMLEKISLDSLNRLRLSSSVILHILEHPNAEGFLKGCFVKVLSPQSNPPSANAPSLPESLSGSVSPDSAGKQVLVCQIVGLKELPEEYTVVVDGSPRQCRYTLTLRPTPKASAKYDRDFSLKELINAPVTVEEFEDWRKKIKHYDAAEDLSKRMRAKQLQLEKVGCLGSSAEPDQLSTLGMCLRFE